MVAPQNTLATDRLGDMEAQRFPTNVGEEKGDGAGVGGFEDEEWEDEADKLYTWTQNLSVEDIGLTTPS